MSMPHDKAGALAARIVSELEPLCRRIEIAGSIRRGRPSVGDIDLVILPQQDRLQDIKSRCRRNGVVTMDGNVNFMVMLPGNVQLDIFFAHSGIADLFNPKPSNFGSLLLLRTGSKEHNVWLIEEAKRRGCAWCPCDGVMRNGKIVAGAEERDIFAAIGIPFINPDRREK